MKKEEIEIGKRVKRVRYTVNPALRVNNWRRGEIIDEYVYEHGPIGRGIGKVKVKFDNQRIMMVPINQLEEEDFDLSNS